MTLHAKIAMSDVISVPLKASISNQISFAVSLRFSDLRIPYLKEAMEKLKEINNFPSQKNDSIFHIFDQIKVSRVPL